MSNRSLGPEKFIYTLFLFTDIDFDFLFVFILSFTRYKDPEAILAIGLLNEVAESR